MYFPFKFQKHNARNFILFLYGRKKLVFGIIQLKIVSSQIQIKIFQKKIYDNTFNVLRDI